jgi:copper chaperone
VSFTVRYHIFRSSPIFNFFLYLKPHVRSSVQMLMEIGGIALTRVQDLNHHTALDLATAKNHVQICELLLSESARELQNKLCLFYAIHNPSAIARIPQLIEYFASKEDELNADLRKKYGVDLTDPKLYELPTWKDPNNLAYLFMAVYSPEFSSDMLERLMSQESMRQENAVEWINNELRTAYNHDLNDVYKWLEQNFGHVLASESSQSPPWNQQTTDSDVDSAKTSSQVLVAPSTTPQQILNVEGMSCTTSCTPKVKKALEEVAGVVSVDVSLDDKSATVIGQADVDALIKAVENAGFEATLRSKQPDELPGSENSVSHAEELSSSSPPEAEESVAGNAENATNKDEKDDNSQQQQPAISTDANTPASGSTSK